MAFTQTGSTANADGTTTDFFAVNGWQFERAYSAFGEPVHCEAQNRDQRGWRATVWRGTDANDPCIDRLYTGNCDSPPPGAPSGHVIFTFFGEGDTEVSVGLPENP